MVLVFPAPRKPVKTVMGMYGLDMSDGDGSRSMEIRTWPTCSLHPAITSRWT